MRQVDHLSNDGIWLSIVGVTDQYLQNHISHSSYAACYSELVTTVMSLNTQDEEGVGFIRQSCEPRFLLYRFWSLYESMLNSEYLVTKLQLSQSQSILNPKNRFQIAFTLMSCWRKQESLYTTAKNRLWYSSVLSRFKYIPMQVRTQLRDRLKSVSFLFHTDDLFYDSFVRRYGNLSFPLWFEDTRTEFSAADVAYAANALLEECNFGEDELVNEHVEFRGNFHV